MSKLTLRDVKILGEGPQMKKHIKEKYKTIQAFYEQINAKMAYDTFRSYMHRETINSDPFKCLVTKALNMSYTDIVLSKPEQIRKHVQNIYDNIWLYNEEKDQKILDYLLEQCKEQSMSIETAMMYRAKARNCYYTHKINYFIEFYEYAMEKLPKFDTNRYIFFYCELAYALVRENLLDRADKKFRDIQDLIEKYQGRLDNNTMHYYYYWRGVMYLNIGKITIAREYFEKAMEYAVKNYEKASTLSNIGLTYKRHRKYDDALKYYMDALGYPDDTNILAEASVYNNIAMVNRLIKDYPNALINIKKAIELSKKEYSLSKHITFIATEAEIKMDMGEHEAYKIFLNALLKTKGKQMFSPDVLNDIKSFINRLNDMRCLDELADVIIVLKDASNSKGYINGLFECLGHIHDKIKKLSRRVRNEKAK